MPPNSSQNLQLQVHSSQSDSDKNKLDKIKLYKTQCADVLRRYRVATRGNDVLHDQRLRLVYSCIVEKLNVWSKWDEVDTFVQHETMQSDLQDLHRRLDAAMAPDIDFPEANAERAKGQGASGSQELRNLVCSIFKTLQNLTKLVTMITQQKRRGDVEGIMQFAQLELMQGTLSKDELATYYEGLYHIYSKTKALPPLATLNGQITLQPHNLTGHGPARWLNKKPVLLQLLPKALAQHKELRPKFEVEVLKWRDLDHSHNNLAPIYGIIDLGSDIYMVSAWTKQGTLLDSAGSDDKAANSLKSLIEVASGLEYLHRNGIIHGSLYAKNILISEDGKACIAYYGITPFLEKHGSGLVDMAETADYRRSAPEITIERQPLSMASDTWSFGMMALEVLTGKQPFDDISPDIWVLSHLERLYRTPCKLTEHIDAAYSLSPGVKRFLDECWNFIPSERASFDVLEGLKRVNKNPLFQGSLIGFPAGESTSNLFLLDENASETSGRSSEDNLTSEPMWASTHYTRSSVSLSPLPIQLNGQAAIPKDVPYQNSEPLAILAGPSTLMQPVRQLSQAKSARSTRRPSQSSSILHQQDRPVNVRQNSQSTTSVLPPPTPPKKTRPLVTIPPVSHRSNTTFLQDRPSTSGSGLSRIDQIVSPGSICGSASILPSTVGRNSQMHNRIVSAFGGSDFIEDQHALLEACSYVKDTRYQHLTSLSPDFEQDIDIQYQAFREVILSLSKPQPGFLKTYMPRLRDLCKRFASASEHLSPEHFDKPSDLLIYIEKRPDFQLLSMPGPLTDYKTLSPLEMAHALAFLQSEKYRAIDPSSDYLDHLILEGSSSSINEALDIHNAIVLWAQNYVLTGNSLQDRFSTVIYLINVAEGCKKIANFASMFAIGEALHDGIISELPVLHKLVTGNSYVKERLQKLSKDKYEGRVRKTPDNNYIPCLHYHLDNIKSRTTTGHGPTLLSLKEINGLMEDTLKKLSSLPAAKPSPEGEKFATYINSQLNPFIGEPGGASVHRTRLMARQEVLRTEETRPNAIVEAKKILDNFKKSSFN